MTDNTRVYNMDCMIGMKEFPDKHFEWKPIPDFEHYLISTNGDVFNTRTKRIKQSCFDRKGYRRIRLTDGRKRCATKKIHRLVAQAFVEGYAEHLQVNHKNCVKHDNYYKNLEMATQSQNTKHAWDSGRMKLTARNERGVFVRV